MQIRARRGLRKIRESHMIVYVTDGCSPASAKQAHLCGESLFLTLNDEGW